MRKYINLYCELIRQSLIRAMAYKINFVTVLLTNLAYFAAQLIFMNVIFMEVSNIAGWTKYEMFFYIGTFAILDAIWVFGPYFNLLSLGNQIRLGLIDSYLLKPVDTQFLVTLRNVDIGSVISLMSGVAMVLFAVVKGNISISYINLILYICVIPMAIIVQYSLYLILSCLAFWLIQSEFAEIFHGIICNFATKPADIYSGLIRKLMISLFPYGILITIASKSALSKVGVSEYIYALIISVIFFCFARIVWRKSLKKYGSSSS